MIKFDSASHASHPLARLIVFLQFCGEPSTTCAHILNAHCWASLMENLSVVCGESLTNLTIVNDTATTSEESPCVSSSSNWINKLLDTQSMKGGPRKQREAEFKQLQEFEVHAHDAVISAAAGDDDALSLCRWYDELFEQFSIPLMAKWRRALNFSLPSSQQLRDDDGKQAPTKSKKKNSHSAVDDLSFQYLIDGLDHWIRTGRSEDDNLRLLYTCGVLPGMAQSAIKARHEAFASSTSDVSVAKVERTSLPQQTIVADLVVDFVVELLLPQRGLCSERLSTAEGSTGKFKKDNEANDGDDAANSQTDKTTKKKASQRAKKNNPDNKKESDVQPQHSNDMGAAFSCPVVAGGSQDWLWQQHMTFTNGNNNNNSSSRKRSRSDPDLALTSSIPPSPPSPTEQVQPQRPDEEEEDPFIVTKDNISLMMQTKPYLLPKAVLTSLRKSLMDPSITAFELEHHYTISDLKTFVNHAQQEEDEKVRQGKVKAGGGGSKQKSKKESSSPSSSDKGGGQVTAEIDWRLKKHTLVCDVLAPLWASLQRQMVANGIHDKLYGKTVEVVDVDAE